MMFGDATPLWHDFGFWGDVIAVVAVALAAKGFAVARSIYDQQKRDGVEDKETAALETLRAAHDGMRQWANDYFDTDYSGKAAKDRAEVDVNKIMAGTYVQNFVVPTEPLAVLLAAPAQGLPIDPDVIATANIALLRVGVFNQFVQRQTDFLVLHAVAIADKRTDDEHRHSIAVSAGRICEDIHGAAVGDRRWFTNLNDALRNNIATLDPEAQPVDTFVAALDPVGEAGPTGAAPAAVANPRGR